MLKDLPGFNIFIQIVILFFVILIITNNVYAEQFVNCCTFQYDPKSSTEPIAEPECEKKKISECIPFQSVQSLIVNDCNQCNTSFIGQKTLNECCCIASPGVGQQCTPIRSCAGIETTNNTAYITTQAGGKYCEVSLQEIPKSAILENKSCNLIPNCSQYTNISAQRLSATEAGTATSAAGTATASLPQITPQFSFLPTSILEKIQTTIVSAQGKETAFLTINWLANFIVWAYTYAVGLGAVLAVLMFMYAGVLYIVSGGDAGKISKAKDIMKSTATGLILFLSAYLILNYINPALVAPKPLTIEIPKFPTTDPKCQPSAEKTFKSDSGKTFCFDPKNSFIIDLAKKKNDKDPTLSQITLYTHEGTAYSTQSMYTKLQAVNEELKNHKDIFLRIINASRPLEEQAAGCDCYQKFLSNNKICPQNCGTCPPVLPPTCSGQGSGHVKASSVDVTLIKNGQSICGTVSVAYNCRTNMSTQGTSCTADIKTCQDLLYSIMTDKGKFTSINNEWWHFDSN